MLRPQEARRTSEASQAGEHALRSWQQGAGSRDEAIRGQARQGERASQEASQASTVGQLPDLGRARGPSAHEDALHAAVLTATEVSERAPSRGPSFSRPMGKSISQTHMSL